MKRTLALLLALVMLFAMAACSSGTPAANAGSTGDTATTYTNADDVPDNMTSADGKYEVAFITDVGQLKDKSFNQGTYDGVKLYAANHGYSYKYYQPANGDQATDDDRYDAMKAAVDAGAKVVVCAGFMQEGALKRAAEENPTVDFIFIDGYPVSDANNNILKNVAGIAFQEEQCGYFAGYAVVKEGYTKLGFCGGGGGDNPACCRYGYGFVQGAAAAAKEMNVNVEVNYSWLYGSSFSASPELQTMANGWYSSGTEIIFACGGSMFASIAAAAAENDGFVVGVDVDQSSESQTVVTSAMKGLSEAAMWAIDKSYAGTFGDIGGTATSLGLNDNAVGLPTATWSMKNFTVADYEKLLSDVKSGALTVDADYSNLAGTENLTLNIVE